MYALSEKDVPQNRDHELLVKVHAAGFCHSDLQVLKGQFGTKLPIVPSHEPAGVIASVGASCDTSKWKVGSRVGVLNYKGTCARCPGCGLANRQLGGMDPRYCENREAAGFHHDGAFAEYMVADPQTTVLLPDGLSYEQAAPLMCAGVSKSFPILPSLAVPNKISTMLTITVIQATVWGSLEKATAGLKPGEPVGIIGIGGLGYLGVQFAKSLGYRTIAIDNRESSRQLAKSTKTEQLKPDLVLDSTDPKSAAAEILKETDGEGLAAVVVCTDSIEVNSWAQTLVRIGGTLGVLGIPPGGPWQFDPTLMVFREMTIRGSYVASRESTERMLETVAKHCIESDLTTVKFEDIPKLLDIYQSPSFKGRLVVKIAE